jgi:predicted nucleic acid binding AN1-type Zn finger protein
MELLDKGKHCSEETCHQLDLLPMKCKACLKYYCTEHFKYESHNCKEALKFNFKIPTCENCNRTIEFKRGKDLNLCLAEHLENCTLDEKHQTSKANRKETESKKCYFKNCKSKDVFVFECDWCAHSYCTKHRVPEVHLCLKNNQSCSSQYKFNNKEKLADIFSISSL